MMEDIMTLHTREDQSEGMFAARWTFIGGVLGFAVIAVGLWIFGYF
jgi:uncharacterized membrane protein YdcZ (DUF606 family)